ncbi:MAG: class I poly(R)-hydroxyalkanoic acid synthase [Rubrobacteraceae bacterium]
MIPDEGSGTVNERSTTPLDLWTTWFRKSMEGISGPEQAEVPFEGDPILATMDRMWRANPLQDILPMNWIEISRSLQTLALREMSDPQRAMQAATEYNVRMMAATMEAWNTAAARMWGLPVPEQTKQVEPGKGDNRFKAPEWAENPYYQTLKQMYLLASEYLVREAERTDGHDTEEEQKLKFHLKQFVDAMAPVNFLFSNPEALRRVMETGGQSLAEGVRHLTEDLQQGQLSMTDYNAFEPGENLAITPGKVVYRNDLIELIQYEPQTKQVYEVPMLIVPPWINKYYILDMRPENSMVNHLVQQGFTVFVVSWKNPDASMEETKFEDYMDLGFLEAADAVRDITGSETVNPMGYCIGGTLLSMTLAYLAEKGEDKVFGPSTFMVALQDFENVGEMGVFIDEPQVDFMEQQMLERGYLDKSQLYNMFNLLRSNDLIWANVVNNYLLGQKPPAFDLLYWNSDGTRMARDAHGFYLRNTYLENNLIEPGKVVLKDVPIDLGKIDGDLYAVGAEKDHIVPWYGAWRLGQLASGKVRFVLASSGHIAGMINPPEKEKGRHWVNEEGDAGDYATAQEWHENATEHEGSWWTDWVAWLNDRSGKKVKPPEMGSETYPPIEDAPGTYVRER